MGAAPTHSLGLLCVGVAPDVKWKSHPNHPESTFLRFNAALALKVSVASLPVGSEQIELAVRTKGSTRRGSTRAGLGLTHPLQMRGRHSILLYM